MPTAPLHQGCAAIQAITSGRRPAPAAEYSSVQEAVGVAGAAHVDAHRGVAVAGEPGMRSRRRARGAVAPAVGNDTRGSPAPGARASRPAARAAPPAGCRPRAGSRRSPRPAAAGGSRHWAAVPAASVEHVWGGADKPVDQLRRLTGRGQGGDGLGKSGAQPARLVGRRTAHGTWPGSPHRRAAARRRHAPGWSRSPTLVRRPA